MMNSLLKKQTELRLHGLAAFGQPRTLVVLKGIPLEAVDPESAAEISLERIAEDPVGWYYDSVRGKRKFVSYEEFLLLDSFIEKQYDTFILLENNLWMNWMPAELRCSEEHIRGLLAHFADSDSDEDDEAEICPVEDITGIFAGLKKSGDRFVCEYRESDLLRSNKTERIPLFPESDRELPLKEAEAADADLQDPEDYIAFVLSVLNHPQERTVRVAGWSGDTDLLLGCLRILSEFCGADLFLLKEKKAVRDICHREEFTQILRQYWNKDASFRNIPVYDMETLEKGNKEVIEVSQENIISDIVEQAENCGVKDRAYRDIFVTASTGSGKSAMFQIPAIYLAEKYNLMTLVISPLISLMNDQISGLEKRGYTKAKTLNSDISPVVKEEIRRKVADGEYHILYLSPETLLARSDVEQLIGDRTIGMIVVDESHIVTTWGKQFRPDYWYLGAHINKLRKRQQESKGRSFVISTFTATAIYRGPEDMYQETVRSLHMLNPVTYLGYMKRNDIDIVIEKSVRDRGGRTEYEPDKFAAMEDLIRRAAITGKKMLIYFPTVRMIGRCWNQLYIDNMTASVCTYHGSLTREEKQESYEKFRSGEKLVMLATKAFGMGVDIPDISIVAHFAPTGNVCDYVQEIGRAARDPQLQGEAYYQYNTHDFKHINTLHGLSRIQKYQLTEVVRKIVDLYYENLKENRNSWTRKRNALLLDAENFAYIFQSPLDDGDDGINKVKTALLMIQKDFEGRVGDKYPPISVRPSPLFSSGYFRAEPSVQRRLLQEYGDCLTEVDPRQHICELDLERIWKRDPDASKNSFPQFKFLLYSRSDKLALNLNYTLTPALSVHIERKEDGAERYRDIIGSFRNYIQKKIIDGKFSHMEEISEAVAGDCYMPIFRARTVCEVLIASLQTWQRKYARSIHPAINTQNDSSGRARYSFSVSTDAWFAWLDRIGKSFPQDEDSCTVYLVNDGGTVIEETAAALGVLEALEVLSFRMSGGANSQIYIYVNQIQPLKNILRNPDRYENLLLEAVAERHTVSVKMLTYLYGNDFTSEQRWDLLEDYFLGKIPEEVEKAVEKEKGKKSKGYR